MAPVPATSTSSLPSRRHVAGVTATGRIYLWDDASLWLGKGTGTTQWHEHHAHQLTVALQGCFRFRSAAAGRWTTYQAAVVPSHCRHQFEIEGATVAHLFVEPESPAGRALTARFSRGSVAEVSRDDARDATDLLRPLAESTASSTPSSERMVDGAKAAIAVLSGAAIRPDRELDPRLTHAIAYMRANIRSPMSLGRVAAAVALSESRFRHLFVAGTGTSFRAYLLWLRINLAIGAVMSGASWTDAAHEAGFSDSAHLTRTHKRMFGIEPTAIRPPPAKL